MKTYKIEITQELANYLQRLGLEIDTRLSIIDRLLTNHKDDPDASVFESVPWKTYMKELEEKQAEYELAKTQMSNYLIPLIAEKEGRNDVMFDWKIEDFSILEATIIIKDN